MSDKPLSHGRLSISANLRPRDLMDGPQRLAGVWTAKVLTLYPQMFPGPLGYSLTGRALTAGLWGLEPIQIRDFATGKHRNVDDTPAGGGAGMVLRADVLGRAIDFAQSDQAGRPLIYLSPRGVPFTHAHARRLSKGPGVTLLCGRFEGVDQRVLDARGVEEVSLGDFVLTGGEIAAQALIDATVRLIPRVLGNAESTEEESFSNGLLEHPQYTRPALWEGRTIPDVLLSGHHGDIDAWRRAQSQALTKTRRPDLWRAYTDPDRSTELSESHKTADKGEEKD
ncbi:MAG: tRNA (guanosine(37)-N1)-methyltransferase TrmD [Pseudomonadota bacterium]